MTGITVRLYENRRGEKKIQMFGPSKDFGRLKIPWSEGPSKNRHGEEIVVLRGSVEEMEPWVKVVEKAQKKEAARRMRLTFREWCTVEYADRLERMEMLLAGLVESSQARVTRAGLMNLGLDRKEANFIQGLMIRQKFLDQKMYLTKDGEKEVEACLDAVRFLMT
jgi:hypothetical protein